MGAEISCSVASIMQNYNPACYPAHLHRKDSNVKNLTILFKMLRQEIRRSTRYSSHSIHGLHLADCLTLNHELQYETLPKVSNTVPFYLAPFFSFPPQLNIPDLLRQDSCGTLQQLQHYNTVITTSLHTFLKVYFCLLTPFTLASSNPLRY